MACSRIRAASATGVPRTVDAAARDVGGLGVARERLQIGVLAGDRAQEARDVRAVLEGPAVKPLASAARSSPVCSLARR